MNKLDKFNVIKAIKKEIAKQYKLSNQRTRRKTISGYKETF